MLIPVYTRQVEKDLNAHTVCTAFIHSRVGYPAASRGNSAHGVLRSLVFSPFSKHLATDPIPRRFLRAVFTLGRASALRGVASFLRQLVMERWREVTCRC